MGRFDTTIDNLPGRQVPPPLVLTGVGGGHDIDLNRFAADGVVLLGKYQGIADSEFRFAGDLKETLEYAYRSAAEFIRSVDEYVRVTGIQAEEDSAGTSSPVPLARWKHPDGLTLRSERAAAVIWCTGA